MCRLVASLYHVLSLVDCLFFRRQVRLTKKNLLALGIFDVQAMALVTIGSAFVLLRARGSSSIDLLELSLLGCGGVRGDALGA